MKFKVDVFLSLLTDSYCSTSYEAHSKFYSPILGESLGSIAHCILLVRSLSPEEFLFLSSSSSYEDEDEPLPLGD
jgi:hypothetical protein